MKRIISLIIAALMLLSAASCTQIPEDTKPEETKANETKATETEKESETTAEPFKGETGNYSGAKFASVADLSTEAVNTVKIIFKIYLFAQNGLYR